MRLINLNAKPTIIDPNFKIIAIDPSLNKIGVAMTSNYGDSIDTYCLSPTKIDDKVLRLKTIGRHLVVNIKSWGYDNAKVGIIEYPSFQVSTRGTIAAQKGYTLDLAFLAGYVISAFPFIKWFLPTPSQWKGNQSKKAIEAKLFRWLGQSNALITDHEVEAAMMIKWYLDNHHNNKSV